MVIYLVKYTFCSKDDKMDFLKRVEDMKMVELTKKDQGCLSYDYYFPIDDEKVILLIERWETPELQEAHCKTNHVKALREMKKNFEMTTDTNIIGVSSFE